MTDQANCLAKMARERMDDPNSWAEAVCQSPILVAIPLESLLSLLK
jgi:hypothetical protein